MYGKLGASSQWGERVGPITRSSSACALNMADGKARQASMKVMSVLEEVSAPAPNRLPVKEESSDSEREYLWEESMRVLM